MLNLGFEDCVTVLSGFKLVESFGEMLERDFIQSDLESKQVRYKNSTWMALHPPFTLAQVDLVKIYAVELKEVQEIFTHDKVGASSTGKFFQREGPPLYTNMPPVSGALAWVKGLIRRLEDPMQSMLGVLQSLEDTDEVSKGRMTMSHKPSPHSKRNCTCR